ncbi:hypothetical protein SYNTR_0017 [Candidatus Syntrophocurvum alkaliphilum]|uniref:ABC transporter domain-containing protein n=1 Tax=Candidatus Syntrophocurvum alkaliphilum TaxID=2293317 RepID=A0A6I6DBN6_9FIRM|nr:ATP-binding cassette domain-containing protein [Candidatus Syntrophocurvum alkaliphilum]QGT98610.1 hypothetical protein SYNTR_0017 [Candidatus Syntrophocurvum alkaliphilum]
MKPQLKLFNIAKKYGDREVVNIDNLEIFPAQKHVILGPNGSGKTTLMRIMSLLTINDRGELMVFDEKVNWSKSQLLHLRRQMAMVTQTSFLFEGNVIYNVAYGLKARKKSSDYIKKEVDKALETVGMSSFAKSDARTLSGGERQKVAIARALVLRPKVLFLDEPTSNIAPNSATEIEKYIKHINNEYKTTIILVTHNLFQAKRLADKVFMMWDGKIIERATPDEIFTNPQDERTKSFLSGEAVF